ncbi:MAG: hypothetical protein HZA89_17225 [Verrucomicrobia bacterium]|nr:hypothetical protein [Verrucomicrobiota bacterium]
MRIGFHLLAGALALGMLGGACAQTSPAADETIIRLFAPLWRDLGEQTSKQIGAKFSLVLGHQESKLFREGNPATTTLKYLSGAAVTDSLTNSLRDALALDKDGFLIKARGATGWLVVPNNFKWLQHVARNAIRHTEAEFDGVFVDNMGAGGIGSVTSAGQPINPKTRTVFTRSQWLAAQAAMLTAMKESMPKDKKLVFNGLVSGERYWSEPEAESPRVLLQFADGAMADSLWRFSTAKLDEWPAPAAWLLDVLMIQDVERRGRIGLWTVRCWTDGLTANNEPDAAKLVPQWRRFTLASCLLGAGPRSHFNFDTQRTDGPEHFPEYDAPLGTATAPMQELAAGGVHGRPFSNGVVLVNPTDKEETGVKLPWAGLDKVSFISASEGRALASPFTIPPHTGLILTVKQ